MFYSRGIQLNTSSNPPPPSQPLKKSVVGGRSLITFLQYTSFFLIKMDRKV